MGLIIDSSLLIAAERGRFDMEAFLESETSMEAVFITSVTASELLHGVHRLIAPQALVTGQNAARGSYILFEK